MFAEVEFEWTVLVQPDAMKSSAHIHRAVILALLKDFNHVKCTAQHGYHVVLTTLEKIGEGRLWERRGCAAFPVRFRCVVFNVFKNEHVLAVVTEAELGGIYADCGPIERLYIPKKHMPHYECLSTEIESVQVIKWGHTINGTMIKKGDVIRVQILGTKWDQAQRAFFVVGGLQGESTGVDGRWPELKAASTSKPPGEGATDDDGWGEPTGNGPANTSGWGEPLLNEPVGTAGWGEPLSNEAVGTGGWGEPLSNEAVDTGGWGEPLLNEDDMATSGWD